MGLIKRVNECNRLHNRLGINYDNWERGKYLTKIFILTYKYYRYIIYPLQNLSNSNVF